MKFNLIASDWKFLESCLIRGEIRYTKESSGWDVGDGEAMDFTIFYSPDTIDHVRSVLEEYTNETDDDSWREELK